MSNSVPDVQIVKKDEGVWGLVKPLVLKSIIGSVVAASLVGVFAMVVGEFSALHFQLFLTITLIVFFSLMSWYDADVSSKRSSTFALIGVCVSLYLLFIGLVKIWYIDSGDSIYPYYVSREDRILTNFGQWIWLALIARAALLHAHLLLNIHRKYNTPILNIVAKVTFIFIVLLALMLSIPHIFEQVDYTEGYWRTLGAVAILDVLGTVLIPLSYALFGPKSSSAVPANLPLVKPLVSSNPDAIKPVYSKPMETQWGNQSQSVQEETHPVGSFRFEKQPKYSRALAWPRYVDGTPLPANSDGTPNFSQVEKY